MSFHTNVDSRSPASLDQLKRMTFGIELECIAVNPLELFEDDDRNMRADAIAALSLAGKENWNVDLRP